MDQNILENSKMVLRREKEFSNGRMVSYMMDNGLQERKMEVECGKELMETLILENGRKVKLKDLEFLFQNKVTDMKESSSAQRSMD